MKWRPAKTGCQVFLLLMLTSCVFPTRDSPGYFEVFETRDAEDNNVGDGFCVSTLAGGECTLRAAVAESNAMAGENTIQLGSAEYTLSLPEQIAITDDLRIRGAGARRTVINGGSLSSGGGRNERIFRLDAATVWISDLTITNGGGLSAAVQWGGAISIENRAFASIQNVVIKNCAAFIGGGAIYLDVGDLIMTDSTLMENEAKGGFAGAIWIQENGRLTMDRSSILSNESNRVGGISNFGMAKITNSTISGNLASSDGRGTGGILNVGTTHLNNVTIYENVSNAFGDSQSAGGFRISSSSVRVTMSNTIIANNTRGGAANDCNGEITSYGYNLIEASDECVLSEIVTGNILGRDPQLQPLASNSGVTESHRPATGSPVIGAGHPQVGAGVPTLGRCEARDQSGRLRQLTGAGRRCDIGSIEGM